MKEQDLIRQFEESLERERLRKESLGKHLPDHLDYYRDEYANIWWRLADAPCCFSDEQIEGFINTYCSDPGALIIPGCVLDPVAFITDVGRLAGMRYAATLGVEEGIRLLGGDDAARGRKVKRGATEGHEAIHGTRDEKEQRWADYQADLEKTHTEHPSMNITGVRKKVAERMGVSLKTITRHTKKTW